MERQQAHVLLDQLGPAQFDAVAHLLEVLSHGDGEIEPLSLSLARAPIEDEELKPEFAESLERSYRSMAEGNVIPHEEILREFGLLK